MSNIFIVSNGWPSLELILMTQNSFKFLTLYSNYFLIRVVKRLALILGINLYFKNDQYIHVKKVLLFDTKILKIVFPFLKKKFPNAIFYLFITNPITSEIDLNFFRKNNFMLYTYSKSDAEKYGIKYFLHPIFMQKKITKKKIIYDFFFIGRDKGRYCALSNLIYKLENKGFKCFIKISLSPNFFLNMIKSIFKSNKHIILDREISIKNYFEILNKSYCIIEINKNTNFLTTRLMEAISYRKKLLTTCKDIVNHEMYPIYKNNIFIIEDLSTLNIIDLKKFITKKIKINKNIDKYTFCKGWISGILND